MFIIGFALLSTVKADSTRTYAIGVQVLGGAGSGIIFVAGYFPVLAPLKVEQHARAIAFFTFVRQMGQVWGVTIGGTILQNQLVHHLPAAFYAQFPAGTAVAYSIIPVISSLPTELKNEVRVAFAESLKVIWQVGAGLVSIGLLSCVAMKGLPLHTETAKEWRMKEETSEPATSTDIEMAQSDQGRV